MSKKQPSFLFNPEPTQRLYHGKTIMLWQGQVRLSDVEGWADNPRLELEVRKWKNEFVGDEPVDQDTLYQMMKDTDHVRLSALADDISSNGLREPIMLTFSRKLLDGNRRFFAIKLACERTKDAAKRQALEMIPAFVMMDGSTPQDEMNILVEENFSPSLKREWPAYVKAQRIRKELKNRDADDVAEAFGWKKSDVKDAEKIGEITDAFIGYASGDSESDEGGLGMTEIEAEAIAADKYQMFNEAKKSLRGHLSKDQDFAEWFYTLMAKDGVFKTWEEVRVAYRAYQHLEGKAILDEGKPGAGKVVRALIQHEENSIKKRVQAQYAIEKFVKFLNGLSTDQKREISDASLEKLREALVLVDKLVLAAKEEQ